MRLCFYPSFNPPRHVLLSFNAIKLVAIACVAFAMLSHSDPAAARAQLRSGVVTRVIDGDTVWVKPTTRSPGAKAGEILKVRIVGIDAPEICQPGGPQALAALRGHVLGQTVTLTSPPSRSQDDYGRVLATIDKQGEDVGRWMVQRGQAWSYSYRRNPGPYAAEQAQARAAGVGLFAQRSPENPRNFRKRHGSCYS
ncbi:MAG: thermonuclease family protein [Polaromonas sp.]|nr:MAG: thermonuclease family protein [Polaromonas sp.]